MEHTVDPRIESLGLFRFIPCSVLGTPHPERTASWALSLFYSWVEPTVRLACSLAYLEFKRSLSTFISSVELSCATSFMD